MCDAPTSEQAVVLEGITAAVGETNAKRELTSGASPYLLRPHYLSYGTDMASFYAPAIPCPVLICLSPTPPLRCVCAGGGGVGASARGARRHRYLPMPATPCP
eukprot:3465880-Rhodomonas_salina.1